MNQIETGLENISINTLEAHYILEGNKDNTEYNPKKAKAFYDHIREIKKTCNELLSKENEVDILVDKG